MIYFSNIDNPTLENMKRQASALSAKDSEQILSQYPMDSPFKLETYAFHPKDKDHFFTMTLLAPDNILYTSLSKEEMSHRLDKSRLHKHDYYELMFVLEGEIYQLIENKRYLYQPGSCCLLNKNVFHTEEHSTDYRVAFLGIKEDFLKTLLSHLHMQYFQIERRHTPTALEAFLSDSVSHPFDTGKKYMNFYPKQDKAWLVSNVHGIFEQLANELLAPQNGSSYIIEGLIVKLFHLLANTAYFDDVPIQIGTPKEATLFHDISNLMAETGGRISREQIAEELHYSSDYVNKVCKKYSGMSLYDYGMSFCMQKAATLLLETDLAIEDIAFSLGFVNRTNFYKQFQKVYGLTPARFRKQHATTS